MSKARANISPDILRIVDSKVSYDEIGVGGIVVITALDAKTDERNELHLQLVSLTEENNHPEAVFAVLSDNFWFYAPNGEPYGTLAKGTLVFGGLAMRHLPQPEIRMVGFGGPDKGRDYSLEGVGEQGVTVIVHQISELGAIPAPSDFDPPPNLESYLSSQAEMSKGRQQEAADAGEKWKAETITDILSKCKGKADHLREELERCGPRGIAEIGNFLVCAYEQDRFDVALPILVKALQEQFSYQPPGDYRADPQFGSNGSCYSRMYAEADVRRGASPSDEEVVPDKNADEHYKMLHSVLSDWSLSEFDAVREVKIAEMAVGQIVLAQTRSGNRYLIEVIEPGQMVVNGMNLKRREGFPGDGFMPDITCSNIFIGNSLVTSEFHSSAIAELYVQKI